MGTNIKSKARFTGVEYEPKYQRSLPRDFGRSRMDAGINESGGKREGLVAYNKVLTRK